VRVLGVRIFCVVMVVMIVVMPPVIMMVMMVMMIILHLQTAHAGAEGVTQRAIRHVRSRRRSTLPFHMMVMAFLNSANFGLKAQNLHAVLAHHTRGWWHRGKRWMLAILWFDVMVIAIIKRQDLLAECTYSAVGWRHRTNLFLHTLSEGF
jgi:hypothetical protein